MSKVKILLAIAILVLALSFVLFSCSRGPSGTEVPDEAELTEITKNTRRLSVPGTRNLRDLGGYAATDGRTVKPGLIYRSDNLHHLNEAGHAALKAMNIRAVTDLRSAPERQQEPDNLPKTSPPITYSVLEINDHPVDIKKLSREIFKGKVSEAEILNLLDHTQFIASAKHRKSWGDWLISLQSDSATPHLFHCTSGKDRAGFGASIFLLTMGVDKQTVKDDFLHSNEIYKDYIEQTMAKINKIPMVDKKNTAIIGKIMGVLPETIDASFAKMEADYGSIDGFIRDGLGISDAQRAELRAKFLQ